MRFLLFVFVAVCLLGCNDDKQHEPGRCGNVTCSGKGECFLDAKEIPYCKCIEGYYSNQLECLKNSVVCGEDSCREPNRTICSIKQNQIVCGCEDNYILVENQCIFTGTNRGDYFLFTINITGESEVDTLSLLFEKPETVADQFDFAVDCNDDGLFEARNITDKYLCEYNQPGIYQVAVTGIFPVMIAEKKKIISIDQWGAIQWHLLEQIFDQGKIELKARDIPDLSRTTSIKGLFRSVQSLKQLIENWDTSNITNMASTFAGARYFNQLINSWDVSSVIEMGGMFYAATYFNQPLNNWDVSSVTNMKFMFYKAELFNQPLNNWDVSGVTNMIGMFYQAISFNQDLSGWDVSKVTRMGGMFEEAESFDQDISNWDVSSVTDMAGMFNRVKLSTENYDRLLMKWSELNLQQNVTFDAGDSKFCAGADARKYIVETYNWSIHDGGPGCD